MKIVDQVRAEIGARLKSERERLGMTQGALAEAIGVGRYSVINYENGASSPTAEHLQRLEVLGIDIYFIITGRRIGVPPQKRSEFNTLFFTLQSLAQAMNLDCGQAELLSATWMLFDLGSVAGTNAADALANHPEALAALLNNQA